MSSTPQPIINPRQIVSLLVSYPKRWLLPALLIAGLIGVYALVHPPTWEAGQALIVRNEAASGDENLGKFGDSDEMKTVQETILELAVSRSVLAAALEQVGPSPKAERQSIEWPSDREVAKLRRAIEIAPPGGAEFGTTEVFYLRAKDQDRRRAINLVDAIRVQLENRFQELRDTKAQSVIGELAKAVELAQADMDASTGRLTALETRVGSDLAELRVLHDSSAGDSSLQRTITEIQSELRAEEAVRESNEDLLELLTAAQHSPDHLIVTSSRLLASQPAIQRLKDGLIDAQLLTANLEGRMSAVHPLVQAAHLAEQEVAENLAGEVAIAIHGVAADLKVSVGRGDVLKRQLDEMKSKLGTLASLRANYSNQLAQVQNRTQLLEHAQDNLAAARASHASASVTSLIDRIDAPDAGINPIGPTRAATLLVGIVGGLVVGLGLLFLTVQPAQSIPTPAVGPSVVPSATPVVAKDTTNEQIAQKTSVQATGSTLSFKRVQQRLATAEMSMN